MERPKITVIGSSNTDLVVKAPKLPAPGETVLGDEFIVAPGGKGANQATAIARLGGDVTFVAKIGMDGFGDQRLADFESYGMSTEFVFRDAESPSGVALIFVDDEGENMIAAAQGANAKLLAEDVEKARSAIIGADVVVLQLETTMEAVKCAVNIAAENNVPVILDPAPGRKLEASLIEKIYCLKPNETEAEILTGIKISDDDSVRQAGRKLLDLGAKNAIITLGKRGAMLMDAEGSLLIPTFEVDAVDATAAGDAFTGGLAFTIASGRKLQDAVWVANAVAALAVTKMGAQPSMPTRRELEKFVTENS